MDSRQATSTTEQFVERYFEPLFVKGVQDFVRVPNTTPGDESYKEQDLQAAIKVVNDYSKQFNIEGLKYTVVKNDIRSLIVYHLDGPGKNVLCYGHLDKVIVKAEEWKIPPRDPQLYKDDSTYTMNGRGSADDGYASFAIFTALKVCQDQGIKLPKITLVLETEEETDSAQLRNLLEQAKDIIGTPDYLICMDSGLVDYKHLWITSSLRGYCEFNLKVACGAQDYHSGEAGGIIPETFNVIRVLLDRLNDPKTGIFKEFQEDIPAWKYEEAKSVVQVVGDQIATKFKMEPGVAYQNTNLEELYLDNVWRPTLAIVGMEGVPNFGAAKNVIRASTSIRVGLRIPPSADPKKIAERIKVLMTTDVPFNAAAEILEEPETGLGWLMKAWEAGDPFKCKLEEISQTYFKSPTFSYGDGASIPFLKELELKYPNTRILALGVLGPGSNAHSKDETLDLNYAKSMICVLADIFKGITTLA